jgi:exonuclease III
MYLVLLCFLTGCITFSVNVTCGIHYRSSLVCNNNINFNFTMYVTDSDHHKITFSRNELLLPKASAFKPKRSLRKLLFSLHLWNPAHQRVHSSRKIMLSNAERTDGRISAGSWNACSVNNKSALIQDHILSRNLDFFNIVETHHESSLSPGLIASTPPTYSFIEKARPMPAGASTVRGPRGGGICIIYKDHYQASVKDTGLFTTFEHLTGYFSLRSFHVLVVTIYRPGSEPVRSSFFTELANLLDTIAKYNCGVIILGDINIHLDELDNADTKHINKLLLSHGFEQLVHLPTDSRNHTLDIFVARSPNSLISTIDVDRPSFSDHSMIHFHIHHQLSPAIFETVERRSFMNFDTLSFEKGLGTELFQLCSCYTSSN